MRLATFISADYRCDVIFNGNFNKRKFFIRRKWRRDFIPRPIGFRFSFSRSSAVVKMEWFVPPEEDACEFHCLVIPWLSGVRLRRSLLWTQSYVEFWQGGGDTAAICNRTPRSNISLHQIMKRIVYEMMRMSSFSASSSIAVASLNGLYLQR